MRRRSSSDDGTGGIGTADARGAALGARVFFCVFQAIVIATFAAFPNDLGDAWASGSTSYCTSFAIVWVLANCSYWLVSFTPPGFVTAESVERLRAAQREKHIAAHGAARGGARMRRFPRRADSVGAGSRPGAPTALAAGRGPSRIGSSTATQANQSSPLSTPRAESSPPPSPRGSALSPAVLPGADDASAEVNDTVSLLHAGSPDTGRRQRARRGGGKRGARAANARAGSRGDVAAMRNFDSRRGRGRSGEPSGGGGGGGKKKGKERDLDLDANDILDEIDLSLASGSDTAGDEDGGGDGDGDGEGGRTGSRDVDVTGGGDGGNGNDDDGDDDDDDDDEESDDPEREALECDVDRWTVGTTEETSLLRKQALFRYPLSRCDTCGIKRTPMRTRHCKLCGTCVSRFDHHCFWIGGCVGERNHARFYWMTLLMSVLMLWGCAIEYTCYRDVPDGSSWWAVNGIVFVVSLLMTGFTFIPVGLCGFHTYMILTNQTTWENQRRSAIYYFRHVESFHMPFSKGIRANVVDFFSMRSRSTREGGAIEWETDYRFPEEVVGHWTDKIWDNEYYSCC